MKKNISRLTLRREVIRALTTVDLVHAIGGIETDLVGETAAKEGCAAALAERTTR
jgi:hypothetical protein